MTFEKINPTLTKYKALVYAQSQGDDIALVTKGILFLGVPHYGASHTFVARLLACTAYWRGASDTLLKLFSTDKGHLKELDDDFRGAFSQPRRHGKATGPHIANFLEMRPEKLGPLSLKEVSLYNARRTRKRREIGLTFG